MAYFGLNFHNNKKSINQTEERESFSFSYIQRMIAREEAYSESRQQRHVDMLGQIYAQNGNSNILLSLVRELMHVQMNSVTEGPRISPFFDLDSTIGVQCTKEGSYISIDDNFARGKEIYVPHQSFSKPDIDFFHYQKSLNMIQDMDIRDMRYSSFQRYLHLQGVIRSTMPDDLYHIRDVQRQLTRDDVQASYQLMVLKRALIDVPESKGIFPMNEVYNKLKMLRLSQLVKNVFLKKELDRKIFSVNLFVEPLSYEYSAESPLELEDVLSIYCPNYQDLLKEGHSLILHFDCCPFEINKNIDTTLSFPYPWAYYSYTPHRTRGYLVVGQSNFQYSDVCSARAHKKLDDMALFFAARIYMNFKRNASLFLLNGSAGISLNECSFDYVHSVLGEYITRRDDKYYLKWCGATIFLFPKGSSGVVASDADDCVVKVLSLFSEDGTPRTLQDLRRTGIPNIMSILSKLCLSDILSVEYGGGEPHYFKTKPIVDQIQEAPVSSTVLILDGQVSNSEVEAVNVIVSTDSYSRALEKIIVSKVFSTSGGAITSPNALAEKNRIMVEISEKQEMRDYMSSSLDSMKPSDEYAAAIRLRVKKKKLHRKRRGKKDREETARSRHRKANVISKKVYVRKKEEIIVQSKKKWKPVSSPVVRLNDTVLDS